MKVIIPVAGHGTRLEPFTNLTQKCLLPVAGKPILGHILDKLIKANIHEVCLIIGSFGNHVIDYTECYKSKLNFKYINQKSQIGLGHAISLALENVAEPVLVLLGDSIFNLDYKKFINSNTNQIGVFNVINPQNYGIVETNGDIVKSFKEKPDKPLSNIAIGGIYLFKNQKKLISHLNYFFENNIKTKGEFQLTDAMQKMLEDGHQFKVTFIEKTFDCGTIKSILHSNRVLLNQNHIDKSSLIKNSKLNKVTIMQNCKVKNSILENVIILSGGSVNNCKLKDRIIAQNEKVEGINTKI